MFGIKWNNKLKPSKVAAPAEKEVDLSVFDKFNKPNKIKVKAWDKPDYDKKRSDRSWRIFRGVKGDTM